ncbi:hypothetical protein FOA52_004819 [Chlamydomonas sp. UWO 241]|nr:hypothetical protein FOA52_004819 [Chlamydomonas sp. UWO 241]
MGVDHHVPLQDISNGGGGSSGAGERPNKRARGTTAGDPSTQAFYDVIASASVTGLDDPDAATLSVFDQRSTRRTLDNLLSRNRELGGSFTEGMLSVLNQPRLLRLMLLPLKSGGMGGGCGDSLIRVCLGLPQLQPTLAAALLELLPLQTSASGSDDGGGTGSIPELIVAQLRWLEVVSDPSALVAKVLEVCDVCDPRVQAQLIGILPEVACDDDQEMVVESLLKIMDAKMSMAVPVLDALSSMQLGQQGVQGRKLLSDCVDQAAGVLNAVDVEDMPLVLRFVLASCCKANAKHVVKKVRDALFFANPADPRLHVPDTKGKGRAGGAGGASPEDRTLSELVSGLQGNAVAGAAMLEEVGRRPGAPRPLVVDLWVLLALHSGHPRQVEAALKAHLADGATAEAWLSKALVGHSGPLSRHCWRPLLALTAGAAVAQGLPAAVAAAAGAPRGRPSGSSGAAAAAAAAAAGPSGSCGAAAAAAGGSQQQQSQHGGVPTAAGGVDAAATGARGPAAAAACVSRGLSHQYSLLFSAFDEPGCRQGVLAALHAHLGSGAKCQVNVALGALARLATSAPAMLAQYGSYLTNVLDHLDTFNHSQLRTLFRVFNALVSPAAGSPGRLMDELRIVVGKALSQGCPTYVRAGVIGAAAELTQRALDMGANPDSDPAAASSWLQRYDQFSGRCRDAGAHATALLFDELAASAAEHGGAFPKGLVLELSGRLTEQVDLALLGDVVDSGAQDFPSRLVAAPDGTPLEGPSLSFNLDGDQCMVYLKLWPLLAGHDASKAAALQWLCPAFRLLVSLELLENVALPSLDAMLGLPLGLFPCKQLLSDEARPGLPEGTLRAMLASVQSAISYCREAVGAFAHLALSQPGADPNPNPGASGLSEVGEKLAGCQMGCRR